MTIVTTEECQHELSRNGPTVQQRERAERRSDHPTIMTAFPHQANAHDTSTAGRAVTTVTCSARCLFLYQSHPLIPSQKDEKRPRRGMPTHSWGLAAGTDSLAITFLNVAGRSIENPSAKTTHCRETQPGIAETSTHRSARNRKISPNLGDSGKEGKNNQNGPRLRQRR